MDPYLQIRGRGRSSRPRDKGGGLRASVWSKNKGGGGLPGRSPGSATVKDTVKLKIRKYLSPGAYIVQRPFLRGLSMEGNLHLKFDWASIIVGEKFTIFALFYFVSEGNFQVQAPKGAYFWRGDLTEDFLRYEFGGGGGLYFEGVIHGRAHFRNFTVVML